MKKLLMISLVCFGFACASSASAQSYTVETSHTYVEKSSTSVTKFSYEVEYQYTPPYEYGHYSYPLAEPYVPLTVLHKNQRYLLDNGRMIYSARYQRRQLYPARVSYHGRNYVRESAIIGYR